MILKVLYSPDLALSYYKQSPTLPDGISVMSGMYTTRACPVLNHYLSTNYAKRVDLGGYHATDHLFRLLKAKQPELSAHLSIPRLIDIKHSHCYTAMDYKEELAKYEPDLSKEGFLFGTCVPKVYKHPEHVVKVHLPHPKQEDPVEAERKKELQRERGKMLQAKLAEIREKKKQEAGNVEMEPKKKAVKTEKPLSLLEQEVQSVPFEKVCI